MNCYNTQVICTSGNAEISLNFVTFDFKIGADQDASVVMHP